MAPEAAVGGRLLWLSVSVCFTFLVTASIASDEPNAGRRQAAQLPVGRVGQFEGELGYYLPERFRLHPERVSLSLRPLGFPLDTARLPNVMLGFFDRALGPGPSANRVTGVPEPGRPAETSGGSSGNSGGLPAGGALLECHGPPCPSFGGCGARFPNVQACWNEHLVDGAEENVPPPINCPLLGDARAEKQGGKADATGKVKSAAEHDPSCSHRQDSTPHGPSALQLFRLSDVYLTYDGFPVNRSHVFVKNGCRRFWRQANYSEEHAVHHISGTVFNWATVPAGNFYHFMVELLPLLLSVAPLMPHTLRHVPWLVRRGQWPLYEQLGPALVGIEPGAVRLLPTFENDLFHADEVIQPMFQDCDHPSHSLWTLLRRTHLLHPAGLPLFAADWTYRAQNPLSASQARKLPADWVVVLAKRPQGKRRALVNYAEVEEEVVRLFGEERVVIFDGNLPVLEARALFGRARLFVAAHGAALTNLIFMPEEATVLEIRPDECPVTIFHLLSNACSLSYHLVFSKGDWASSAVADVPKVARALGDIHDRFLEEGEGNVWKAENIPSKNSDVPRGL